MLRPVALVDEQVIPFTTVDEELAISLASQAAVAFENTDLIQRIRTLFETFVHAAVAAIEQRDPTTSGHSERVAILTVGLIERVDAIGVRSARRHALHAPTRSRSCATPRCSTTSARWRCRRSTCARARSSTPAR